jgi:hypothetical protein
MSNDLQSLKSKSNLAKLLQEVEKIDKPEKDSNKKTDDRFFKPELDKSGNGFAVIRFLPAPKGEDIPWVRIWSHAFQGPTGLWYIENSLTTLNQKDPVSELNTKLWNTGSEADKEIARKQKRKLTYIANILVLQDPKHPENEGKVFLFKFGKKIFDKIRETMEPQFEDEKAVNPFDFWEGANFKLKIRKVEGYQNYDKSEFDSPSALFDGDDGKIEKVWSTQHALSEFVAPTEFKSYDKLKERLDSVLSGAGKGQSRAVDIDTNIEDESEAPWKEDKKTPAILKKPVKLEEDDDEEAMSYFQKLANE